MTKVLTAANTTKGGISINTQIINTQLSNTPTAHAVHWYILGTGAIACLWAAALRHSGAEVTLIAREKPGLALTQAQALRLNSAALNDPADEAINANSRQTFSVELSSAKSLHKQRRSIRHLIIATKAYDAEVALASLLALLTEQAVIISLCNGVGFQNGLHQQLQQHSGHCQLLLGLTSDGALLQSPFTVQHTGIGETSLGVYGEHLSVTVNTDTQTLFKQNLLPEPFLLKIDKSNNIQQRLWNKVLINCVINPLTLKHRINNGELLSQAVYRHELEALCDELCTIYNQAVAAKPDNALLQLASKSTEQLLADVHAVASATAANTSSMLRDAQLGRSLELDYLNTYMVNLAQSQQLPCPINQQLIKQLSTGPI